MLKKLLPSLSLLGLLILVMTACVPVTRVASFTDPTPAPQTAQPQTAVREAQVESVDIEILKSDPVQINAVASVKLPDACTTLGDSQLHYASNTFQITLWTVSPTDRGCAQVITHVGSTYALNAIDLQPGTYTVTVNRVSKVFTLTADDITPDATPAAYALGSINGWVWHDLCAVSSEGGSIKPSAGCVQAGLLYHANGILENGEPPIGGVKVTLGAGACPSSGLKETTTITTDLSYSFTGLEAGTYCVAIDPSLQPNAPILRPGSWTYPALVDGPISTTIILKAGENTFDVNFGWDYRFWPPIDEACVDKPVLVADVTIPDNTVMAPSSRFAKTWRVRNDGNCTWGPGLTLHALDFVYGAQLGAPTEVPLAQNVPPGSTFDVSIEMIAPNDPGLYGSEWMFHIADGPLLGVGADRQTPLSAQIIVGAEDAPSNWQTYTSTTGLFSIRYPATDAFYENEIPSVDGVVAPMSNTIAIRISAPDPLILSVTFKPIKPNTSLAAFAAQDDACVAKSRGDPTQGEPLEISGQAALLFRDTPCGPNGSTVIYTTHGALGYRLAIPFVAPYEYVKGWVAPILDTFQLLDQSSAAPTAFCTKPARLDVKAGKVSYNGITFKVDPALAKSVMAQGCPAVAYRPDLEPGTAAHPAYTVFKFPTDRQRIDFQPELRVYTVEDDLQSYLYPINSLGDLKHAINQRPDPATWFDGTLLHVHRNYLDFANGAGVRGVVEYAQDYFFFTNNGLLYEFDGLAKDGRDYINARFPIATSFLMDIEHSDPNTNVNSHAIGIPNWPSDYNDQGNTIKAYNAEALRRFDQMAESDFTPDLAALDALVKSIQIVSP